MHNEMKDLMTRAAEYSKDQDLTIRQHAVLMDAALSQAKEILQDTILEMGV